MAGLKRWPSESTLLYLEREHFHFFYQLEAVFGRQRAGAMLVNVLLGKVRR